MVQTQVFMIVDAESQRAVLVRAKDMDRALKMYLVKYCGLDDEDLKEALESREGLEVSKLSGLAEQTKHGVVELVSW